MHKLSEYILFLYKQIWHMKGKNTFVFCLFQDGLIDQLYEHLLECLHVYSYSISFPELALPAALQVNSNSKCLFATPWLHT